MSITEGNAIRSERADITAGNRPRLCFVGPMLGVNPGWVTSQGELLAGLLADAGYHTLITSHKPARIARLADILRSLVAWRNDIDLVIHQVFSGPAFAVTDAASALCRVLGRLAPGRRHRDALDLPGRGVCGLPGAGGADDHHPQHSGD
ncbi:MAG: hypothetical protein DCC51_15570 [Anaerolineae bacterium]|nr:MAG: hypothetical protein DCC51_15570 [Anaerolineae bacterium]